MFKKLIILALVVMSLFTALVPMALADTANGLARFPLTMYVTTGNGGYLNIRSTPAITERNVIGKLDYGTAVTVTGVSQNDPDWVSIRYTNGTNGTAWVLKAFLSEERPTMTGKEQAAITEQLKTYRAVDKNFTVIVKPSRADGYVNFRTQPGTGAPRITTLKKGHTLTVIGETNAWYQAVDNATGQTGYISKSYVTK